ncbi:MAG: AAA family ATPase [Cyanobacteria bacterium J06636_16]
MSLKELKFSIQAGNNVVSLQTQLTERPQILDFLCREIALPKNLPCYLWNLGLGGFRALTPSVGNAQSPTAKTITNFNQAEPLAVLAFLLKETAAGVFVLEDLHPFLSNVATDMTSQLIAGRLVSQVTNIAQVWAGKSDQFLILLGAQEIDLPPLLASIVPEIYHPLPNYEDRTAMLVEFLPQLDQQYYLELVPPLAAASGGLTLAETKAGLRLIYARQTGRNRAQSLIDALIDYKVERLKTFNLSFSPKPNVRDFGGMDQIRSAIAGIKQDFSHAARQSGIPLPKGWLMVGPPGTGKTFISKFCASALNFPMISVDTGAVTAEGAAYLRRLIDRVEAAAPAVVYFDELDKLFPDPGVPTSVDQRQVLGFLLTWLQDKTSHTFVVATLNRLDSLPPELTRLGRFDEIFYVGFPNAFERKQILHLHLARFDSRYQDGNDPLTTKDWRVILSRTINCTGAELSTMVEKAAKKLFHTGQSKFLIGREELLAVRKEMTPLYMRDTDRILKIENMAKSVARPSSSPDSSIFAPPPMTLWGEKLAMSPPLEEGLST